MKVTIDTDVLVRLVVGDDERQAGRAARLFASADLVAVGVQTLVETVRVLRGFYGLTSEDVAAAVRAVVATEKVVVDRAVVAAGLAALEAGGDFADGVIVLEGARLGGEDFVSFDEEAVAHLAAGGAPTLLL